MIGKLRRLGIASLTLSVVGSGGALLLPQQEAAVAAEPTPEDVAAVLSKRSPGERAAGALTQTKPARFAGGPSPTERVLSGERSRPPLDALAGPLPDNPPGAVADVPVGPGGVVAPGDDGGFADTGPGGPSFADVGYGPIGGGGVIGGGGGGGGSDETTPPDTGTTPPGNTPAVPEPATWLSMILGLFATGAALRRRGGQIAAIR